MTDHTPMNDSKTANQSILGDMKDNIHDKGGYFIFLTCLLIFLIYYLTLTFDMSERETWLLPRIVILFGILFVMADMIKVAFYNRIGNVLSWGDERADVESEEEQTNDVTEVAGSSTSSSVKSLIPFGMIREIGWVLAFAAALYYIGFFTGTFVFAFSYMLTHQEKLTLSAGLKSLSLSIGIVGFLWFLFVEIMGSSSIFRLGLLP